MDSSIWNSIVSRLPNPHFLQTYEWGQVKAKYGWTPLYAVWDVDGEWKVERDSDLLSTFHLPAAAALILKRQIIRAGFAARLSVLYTPRGPLLDWTNAALKDRVLDDLQSLAKKHGAIFLKVDPDVSLGTGLPGSEAGIPDPSGEVVVSELKRRGWRSSSDQIQFRNTVVIDLKRSEEELLARMKQKTRYNIRLAQRKGVSLRVGKQDDLSMLYEMYAETSLRDGFVIRDAEYYRMVWTTFMKNARVPVSNPQLLITDHDLPAPFVEPLIAEVDNEPVAAIFVFYFARRAYYVYGMSRASHREKMPTYLLQWEAMKRAKARGCLEYDLWGAPDVFDETDSMWGVYRFKEGLGGKVVRTLGAWDFVPNPLWYKMYSEVIPRVLGVMRARGKSRTKQQLGA
ncbi:MAG TPA: peptidoglycan bridge formation glycyltransferase FemA/FemB family protein [Anaerolineales bacterium]|nr:peptidoglycan bridge formation glycyltransferase FemA/FemB family protein [Anaerolineales bacterium]